MKKLKRLTVLMFFCLLLGVLSLPVSAATLSKTSLQLFIGKTEQLTVADADGSVTWKSSKPAVAEVAQNGLVVAKTAGQTVITAATDSGTLRCSVTVKHALTVNKKSVTIKGLGSTAKIKVNFPVPSGTVTFKEGNSRIAEGEWGEGEGFPACITLTAKKPGKTTLKISSDYNKEVCVVNVTVKSNPQLSAKKLTLPLFMTGRLSVQNKYGRVKWTSTNPRIASVKDGVVTAKGVGSCTIKATVDGKTKTCRVTVRPNARSWNVVTRAGYYRRPYDYYKISDMRYNEDGSLSLTGYYINTHLYNIERFDYFYIEIEDRSGKVIASYKTGPFYFTANTLTVNPLNLTIPAGNVTRYVDLTKDNVSWDFDAVYDYHW